MWASCEGRHPLLPGLRPRKQRGPRVLLRQPPLLRQPSGLLPGGGLVWVLVVVARLIARARHARFEVLGYPLKNGADAQQSGQAGSMRGERWREDDAKHSLAPAVRFLQQRRTRSK